jgi:DNA-binding MarR family transcriptional regulator
MISKELKQLDLTHEQYNVLRILKGKHPEQMCVKDIGCRMIERSSNVPRIIDRLVAKELVERTNSSIDKRETVMTLTKVGMDVLKKATQAVDNAFNSSLTLDEQQAGLLNQLLEKYREKE